MSILIKSCVKIGFCIILIPLSFLVLIWEVVEEILSLPKRTIARAWCSHENYIKDEDIFEDQIWRCVKCGKTLPRGICFETPKGVQKNLEL